MKNNRTNRKLKFIRAKNKLRLGKHIWATLFNINWYSVDYYDLIDMAEARLMQEHNIKLRHVEIMVMYHPPTIRITLHNSNNRHKHSQNYLHRTHIP